MIIFKYFLNTFEASIFFEAAGEVAKIGLRLKPNHQNIFKQVLRVQITQT
jgi:hypothetical protein